MELKCPNCTTTGDLTTFTSAKNAEVQALLDQIPECLRDAVAKYCELFKPEKTALTPKKMARLISELLPDIHRQSVNVKSMEFPAPHDAWLWAIDRVLQVREKGTIKPPLPSHGYLYACISSFKTTQSQPAAPVPTPAASTQKHKTLLALKGLTNEQKEAYIESHREAGETQYECFQRLLNEQEQSTGAN